MISAAQPARPLKVMFVITSMEYGGAETLLSNLVRRLDRQRFSPELCCIKRIGRLGEELAREIPVHAYGMRSRYDFLVLKWLTRLLLQRRVDVVITCGGGDKMFWGRLAAWRAGAPLIISALHTTGWPDCVGRLNRCLTPLNDAFIGVAEAHARFLVEGEKFPSDRVHVIPNGVSIERFRPRPPSETLRRNLKLSSDAPVVGIVARLGKEKNHEMFLQVAARVRAQFPTSRFLVIGDGPLRSQLEARATTLGLSASAKFLGSRSDVPDLLSLMDVFVLTSDTEANPVSILEAMASGKPVVATRVGSVSETVIKGESGYLVEPGDVAEMARHVMNLIRERDHARHLGQAARQYVRRHWSLEQMVRGYEELMSELYSQKMY